MNHIKYFLWITSAVFVIFLGSSCRSKKDISYFQQSKDTSSNTKSNIQWKNFPGKDSLVIKPYDPIIRHNDMLEIYVSSINPEASSFFNPILGTGASTGNLTNTNPEISGYLVDINGEVELPLVGPVKVAGLTVPMIRDTIKKKLEKYLENPTVRVVFQNFRVTVLGEVERPGIYSVRNERITFAEAIGLAGDLNIYGRRSNILIVREENGKTEFASINVLDRSLFESPFYYLHPNDVVYVEPVGAKIMSSDDFFRWYSFVLTNITFLLLLLNLVK